MSFEMQALSCGSPSAMAASVAAPLLDDGFTIPELEKSQAAKPGTDRMINKTRLSTTRPDVGTPSRIPVDSIGQRLCSTPKIARPAGGVVRNLIGSQTPKSVRASGGMRNIRASATPMKTMQPIDVKSENHAPSSEEEESRDTPLEAFTIYGNPSFEPLVLETAVDSPIKEQKQASCVPVDSNGQKLCPTPKRTPSFNSPGVFKLRFPKATSFQPLETIQSPVVPKEQTRGGVLTDSNGQCTFETPKQRASPFFSTSSAENLTPRALFNDAHGPAAATPQTRSATKARPAGSTPTTAKRPLGAKLKKRTRAGGDGEEGEGENARVTRSKREAEKIAQFLRSPAARVRPDGRREEFWQGVSEVLVERYAEMKSAVKVKVKAAAP